MVFENAKFKKSQKNLIMIIQAFEKRSKLVEKRSKLVFILYVTPKNLMAPVWSSLKKRTHPLSQKVIMSSIKRTTQL